jgi:hypothetical protein
MADDTPRFSDRGVQSLIGETLVAAVRMLDEAQDSPHVRELRARARTYERILAQWATVPPSGPQRDATFDLVTELHAMVSRIRGPRGESDSVRPRKDSGE